MRFPNLHGIPSTIGKRMSFHGVRRRWRRAAAGLVDVAASELAGFTIGTLAG